MNCLLAADEPPPFEVVEGATDSPYVVLADHAGRLIPRALGQLGLSKDDLDRHIAWDIGAQGLARELARCLGGWLILQNYSRLVIDCNRPKNSPESIVLVSEDTAIPRNHAVPAEEAALRAEEIFDPYHMRISRELDERQKLGRAAVVIFVHSFTPVYRGVTRPWHAGVLHLEDTRLSGPLLAGLRQEPGLTIGDNEPYGASVLTDFSLVQHGLKRGLLHVELEVRQDLLLNESGQQEWANRLARLLKHDNAPGSFEK